MEGQDKRITILPKSRQLDDLMRYCVKFLKITMKSTGYITQLEGAGFNTNTKKSNKYCQGYEEKDRKTLIYGWCEWILIQLLGTTT